MVKKSKDIPKTSTENQPKTHLKKLKRLTKHKQSKKESIKNINSEPLKDPVQDHFFTFQLQNDLPTLLYCSIIFKWIDISRILIIVNNSKLGYHIDLFLRTFKLSSIFLDNEMPLNTNEHFYNQFVKGNNYNICIINDKYNEKSKLFYKEILNNISLPITVIFFDCCNKELLEDISFHINTSSIYHFMHNKEEFLDAYENLNEAITFEEFDFDKEQMCHLRYRCEDIYIGISKNDIKREKIRKINVELLHSKQMAEFFRQNPNEKMNVVKNIEENTLVNNRQSCTYLPSYLIHKESNVIADAIKEQYKNKKKHMQNNKNTKKYCKKKKMEQYFEALDKGDGSQDLIKF